MAKSRVPRRKAGAKRVAIYLRVSTAEQTTANQRRGLQAVAARHGWTVARVFEDAGISGTKARSERPALDAMLKAVARREVDMVAAWSVDRLGRSLTDLLDLLRELHAKGVDLFLHQQGLDTSTPSGRAMFQMMGVFAEFERAMIRERVLAGLARAKEQGRQLGRRRIEDTDKAKAAGIRAALANGKGVRRIARDLKVGVGTVLRMKTA
jgi:DNA invertase Pin-like site-specific DNA recombinase